MIGFREFLEHGEQINETIVRKGAVVLYATQAKRNGDDAVRSYQVARQALTFQTNTSVDEKVDDLAKAIIALTDGLIATRKQLGSISAQVTASNI